MCEALQLAHHLSSLLHLMGQGEELLWVQGILHQLGPLACILQPPAAVWALSLDPLPSAHLSRGRRGRSSNSPGSSSPFNNKGQSIPLRPSCLIP